MLNMDKSADYITEEKRKSLEVELEDLRGPKRREILASLEYAKSLGDLSENAEYHQTREDQGKLEERIAKIEQILQFSETVHGGGGEVIEITKEEKVCTIVGSEEADMVAGKISNKSPFGEALFGKKKGDKVSFKTPIGVVNYKILSVS
ncbi:MAG: Transcription elongation factor GreA [Parcubacteria group bacterium GW2011_GWF2_42_7]|nr:MAG: Transcription elongation factor GreA [Parcubacteria group bacterium GW2011_GWF2_42_7]